MLSGMPEILPGSTFESGQSQEAFLDTVTEIAGAAYYFLQNEIPDVPAVILSIGDNWDELYEITGPRGDLPAIGGEAWPLMKREPSDTGNVLLDKLQEGAEAGSLHTKKLAEVIILDYTAYAPLFREQEIESVQEYSWGRIVRLKGKDIDVYHITKADLLRKPPEAEEE